MRMVMFVLFFPHVLTELCMLSLVMVIFEVIACYAGLSLCRLCLFCLCVAQETDFLYINMIKLCNIHLFGLILKQNVFINEMSFFSSADHSTIQRDIA